MSQLLNNWRITDAQVYKENILNEINFGAVAEFYEADELRSLGASYRTSSQDIEMSNSIEMLREHLRRYYQKSDRRSESNEVPSDNGRADYTSRDLDDFFNES